MLLAVASPSFVPLGAGPCVAFATPPWRMCTPDMGARRWLEAKRERAGSTAKSLAQRMRRSKLRQASEVLAPTNSFQEHNVNTDEGLGSAPHAPLQLSKAESESLAALRRLLAADLEEAPPFEELTGDDRLLRFLRKTRSIERAASRYREMLAWRREWNVDDVRRDIVENDLTMRDIPHFEIVNRHMRTRWSPLQSKSKGSWRDTAGGSDRQAAEGLPLVLYTQMNGDWDCPGIVSTVKRGDKLTQKAFLTHWIYVNEFVALQLHALSVEHRNLAMVHQVCDFDRASLGLLYPPFYIFAAPWVKMTQRNYPHTAATIDFVHPPRFLSALWKLLTPLFDPDTVEKMRVVDVAEMPEHNELHPLPPTSQLQFLAASESDT